MRRLVTGVAPAFVAAAMVLALALGGCAGQGGTSPRQSLFIIEQTFVRVVNQVASKCQQRVLTRDTCLAASGIAETTQSALEQAWATDTSDYDSIQNGIRQLQAILKGPQT
jgi:hypothetical protein